MGFLLWRANDVWSIHALFSKVQLLFKLMTFNWNFFSLYKKHFEYVQMKNWLFLKHDADLIFKDEFLKIRLNL